MVLFTSYILQSVVTSLYSLTTATVVRGRVLVFLDLPLQPDYLLLKFHALGEGGVFVKEQDPYEKRPYDE